jgi:hypothetical protein
VASEGRFNRLGQWALETALALLIAGAVYFLWPRVAVERLGREEVWFAWAWLLALAGPSLLEALRQPRPSQDDLRYTFESSTLSYCAFILGGLFVALIAAGGQLGNYKLWLGMVYLAGTTLRLAGLSLSLRSEMLSRHTGELAVALSGAAISALAGLLVIPWLRIDLVGLWPPPISELARPLVSALLWGAISGMVLLVLRLWGGGQRTAWLGFLAVGLGPGPALAVSWFGVTPMLVALAVLALSAVLRLLGKRGGEPPAPAPPRPMGLYWLLRALVLLWWGVGGTIALAAAWWQPQLEELFTGSIWLRAVGLGGFVVACVGLLAENTLPLLGRPGWMGLGRQRKLPGVILSALALLLAFSPLLLTDPYHSPSVWARSLQQARADLLKKPLILGPNQPEVELKPPYWINGLNRVFVVSFLKNGAAVRQGEPVAQLVAVDGQDLPHIFNLRAGIDTAERQLNKRDVAAVARHGPARVAQAQIVYTPVGEAYSAQSYFTGLYLGRQVTLLKSVRLRYLYENPTEAEPVLIELARVFVN